MVLLYRPEAISCVMLQLAVLQLRPRPSFWFRHSHSVQPVSCETCVSGRQLVELDGGVGCAVFSPQGHSLGGLNEDGAVRVWCATTGPTNSE